MPACTSARTSIRTARQHKVGQKKHKPKPRGSTHGGDASYNWMEQKENADNSQPAARREPPDLYAGDLASANVFPGQPFSHSPFK